MENTVQLERIQVKKLFNRFTYDINVKNGYDVAIIIAPNGCGKTTIFKLLDIIFKPTFSKLQKFKEIPPFEECLCTLSNGVKVGLEVRKVKDSEPVKYPAGIGLGLERLEAEGKAIYLIVDDDKYDEINLNEAIFDCGVIDETFNPNKMQYLPDPFSEAYSGGFYDKYKDVDINDIDEDGRLELQNFCGLNNLRQLREKCDCRIKTTFISADRLNLQKKPIEDIQNSFNELYGNINTEYIKLLSKAKDDLPKKFLGASKTNKMSFEEFDLSWKEYVSDIKKYYELGLLKSSQTIIDNNELKKYFKDNEKFLTVYLETYKNTLEPWNREYAKLKLFADIINSRNSVTGKVLKYSPNGLVISDYDGEINLEYLSSGEKNDLIMFFNLIFNSEKGSLVLVDEPEISLHIQWQEEYLDWLLKICEMNELKAIVATHSPNIVNGHIELYADRGLIDERRGN